MLSLPTNKTSDESCSTYQHDSLQQSSIEVIVNNLSNDNMFQDFYDALTYVHTRLSKAQENNLSLTKIIHEYAIIPGSLIQTACLNCITLYQLIAAELQICLATSSSFTMKKCATHLCMVASCKHHPSRSS